VVVIEEGTASTAEVNPREIIKTNGRRYDIKPPFLWINEIIGDVVD